MNSISIDGRPDWITKQHGKEAGADPWSGFRTNKKLTDPPYLVRTVAVRQPKAIPSLPGLISQVARESWEPDEEQAVRVSLVPDAGQVAHGPPSLGEEQRAAHGLQAPDVEQVPREVQAGDERQAVHEMQ